MRKRRPRTRREEIPLQELKAIVERARAGLSQEDCDKLEAAVDTLAVVTRELDKKGTSIKRLRSLLFGISTERTSRVLGEAAGAGGEAARDEEGAGKDGAGAKGSKAKGKRKGHGRNGASEYRGADNVKVPHESLEQRDLCPSCEKGKVYRQEAPAVLVRVTGMAPLHATVYEKERLRCNLCGEVFTAPTPEGVGEAKYDETAAAMIGLLKYGCGLPFTRLERLQHDLGIPLPASTQWEVAARAAQLLAPAYRELIRQAAQGQVLYNDDTTMKILDLAGQAEREKPSGAAGQERTGVFTSGIVSSADGREIALFFTGRKHAGESLAEVLAERAEELEAPIQMCDALSRNTAGDFKTVVSGCNAHARRRFVEVADSFPDECRHVLETLREVYRNDAVAQQGGMSPEERLRFHQEKTRPITDGLKKWLQAQLAEHKVEPNSGLGEAIRYMLKHWDKLTLFLSVAGAPIDNNLCERALKKAILHRKNALFYKTEKGARVGDLFMSLIHTAELCKADPFDYLVQLQRHSDEASRNPADWMPWSYRSAVSNFDDTG
jgi:transposase